MGGIECDYSFDMLYKAAFGRNISQKKKKQLQSLSQEKINELVTKWAEKAGWNTEEKQGDDGATYIAFYPSTPIVD